MKKLVMASILTLILVSLPFKASGVEKLSQLPLGTAAGTISGDSVPYVAAGTGTTQRLTLWDLINLPPFVSTYAPLASPTFTGTVTLPLLIGTNATDSSSSITGAIITAGGIGIAKSVNIGTTLGVTGAATVGLLKAPNLLISGTNAAVTTYGCTAGSPAILANGTATFRITQGSGTCGSTMTLNMPAATTGWNCYGQDISNAGHRIQLSTASATAPVVTHFNIGGTAVAFDANEIDLMTCLAY